MCEASATLSRSSSLAQSTMTLCPYLPQQPAEHQTGEGAELVVGHCNVTDIRVMLRSWKRRSAVCAAHVIGEAAMRLYLVMPKDRKMTRQQWRELDRQLRIHAREQQKAAMNMWLFGTGAVEITSDGQPRSLSMKEIGSLRLED